MNTIWWKFKIEILIIFLLFVSLGIIGFVLVTFEINDYIKITIKKEYDQLFVQNISIEKWKQINQNEITINVSINGNFQSYKILIKNIDEQIQIQSNELLNELKNSNLSYVQGSIIFGKTTFIKYIFQYIFNK
ncbi:MAG1140 family protein [Mycoplasmopsis cricetuli]|uniref:MAG1140 family protein n=1 Tax=Mycoplasmopsis cricetuli TaxID=171283 RepID=UPI0004715B33